MQLLCVVPARINFHSHAPNIPTSQGQRHWQPDQSSLGTHHSQPCWAAMDHPAACTITTPTTLQPYLHHPIRWQPTGPSRTPAATSHSNATVSCRHVLPTTSTSWAWTWLCIPGLHHQSWQLDTFPHSTDQYLAIPALIRSINTAQTISSVQPHLRGSETQLPTPTSKTWHGVLNSEIFRSMCHLDIQSSHYESWHPACFGAQHECSLFHPCHDLLERLSLHAWVVLRLEPAEVSPPATRVVCSTIIFRDSRYNYSTMNPNVLKYVCTQHKPFCNNLLLSLHKQLAWHALSPSVRGMFHSVYRADITAMTYLAYMLTGPSFLKLHRLIGHVLYVSKYYSTLSRATISTEGWS